MPVCQGLRPSRLLAWHETGGMCIEVAADDGTRILLDLGMPLQASDVAASVLTHSCLDNCGRTALCRAVRSRESGDGYSRRSAWCAMLRTASLATRIRSYRLWTCCSVFATRELP